MRENKFLMEGIKYSSYLVMSNDIGTSSSADPQIVFSYSNNNQSSYSAPRS